MATPPTRVSYNVPTTGNFSATATSRTTTSFDVTAGDIIVVLCSLENAGSQSAVTPSASGGSVTWTQQVRVPAASNVNTSAAWCWTGAVGATATGITVTLNRPSTDASLWWGMSATVFTAHGGVGAVFNGNNGTSSSAPSVAATCAANSAVVCQVNDWNAADGTSRTYRTINGAAETETVYFRNATRHTVYGAYRTDTGAAGTITQGLTAPSGQRWVLSGVEILGTTGGGGTTHDLASTGTGTSTGSLAVSLVQSTSSTGAGSSTGSVNLLLAPGALSATGTGTTGGSAALSLQAAVAASGTGQTAGSVDVTLDAAPLSLGATGSGSSTGSLAVNLQLSCSSTGTGQTTGTADLTIVGGPLGLSATGTGTSTGSLNVNVQLSASSSGTGTSSGSAALISTLQVSATGTGTSTGTAAITVRHGIAATGTGQTAGSLDVTIPFGDTYSVSATGTGTSSGSLELTRVVPFSATGTGATAGSLVLNLTNGQLRAISVGNTTTGALVLNLQHKLTASGATQTAGSLAMRISTLRLSSEGYTFSTGSLELSEPTFAFSMPTHEEPMRVDPNRVNRPLAYYRLTYAPSLVKVNGSWVSMRTPPPELLAGLTAGVDYFLGGFEYEISQQLARELALAGYTANPM